MTYFNRRVARDGYTFDSQREYARYLELCVLANAGEIRDLEVHPSWELVSGVTLEGRRKPAIRYSSDFSYYVPCGPNSQQWMQVVEDVKPKGSHRKAGYRTPIFRLKKHLMKAIHGIEIVEVT